MKQVLKNTFLATLVPIANTFFSLITTKLVAYFLGPLGFSFFSQIKQTLLWLTSLSTLNGKDAVVKYLEQHRTDGKLPVYVYTIGVIYLFSSLLVFVILTVGASYWAHLLFNGTAASASTLLILGFINFFACFSGFFLSLINGFRDVKRMIRFQIITNLLSLVSLIPVLIYKDFTYLLLNLFSINLIGFIIGIIWARKNIHIDYLNFDFKGSFNKIIAKSHVLYSTTISSVSLLGLFGVIMIRSYYYSISKETPYVGYFDAAYSFSTMYLSFLLSSYSVYYFPLLSSKTTQSEISETVKFYFNLTITLMVPLVSFLVVMKSAIIPILFSKNFIQATELLNWLFISDFFKSLYFVLGMLMLSFADKKTMIIIELLNVFIVVLATAIFVKENWLIYGIVSLFCNTVYFLYMLYYAKNKYQVNFSKNEIYRIAVGAGIICIFSALSWSNTSINLLVVFLWVAANYLYNYKILNKENLITIYQSIKPNKKL